MPRLLLFAFAVLACTRVPATDSPAPPSRLAGDQVRVPTPTPAPVAEPAATVDVAPIAEVSARSTELNTEGYRAYKAGNLAEAARLFRAAIEADDDNALAHYNLACTLALLRRSSPACEHDATMATILDHLARSVELDEGRRQRMREDSDLDDIRDLLRYRLLDQGQPTADADLERLLGGVSLWAPAVGIYGSTGVLSLRLDGSVGVTRRVLEDDTVVDRAEPDGRWTVGEGAVRLELGEDSQELALDPEGHLRAGDSVLWFGHPSECSA